MSAKPRTPRAAPHATRVAFGWGADGEAVVAMTFPSAWLGADGPHGLEAPRRLGFAVGMDDEDELEVPDADPGMTLWVGSTSVVLTWSDRGRPRAWLTAGPCVVDGDWRVRARRQGAVLVLAPDSLALPAADVDVVGHLLDGATRGVAAVATVRVA